MNDLIDIGLNLMHSSFKKDRVEIIEEAKKVGVNQFIITGTNIHSSHMAREYASKYPNTLFSTSGVHPHDAKTCNGHTIFELEKIAKDDCVVAIGECGLDYNRNFSPQNVQRKWFEAQVELAETLDMPLFLHEREAHDDLYNILSKHDQVIEKSVVHCFTGTKEEAQKELDRRIAEQELLDMCDWDRDIVYCVIYNQNSERFDVNLYNTFIPAPYRFASIESAQKAIDTLGAEKLKLVFRID